MMEPQIDADLYPILEAVSDPEIPVLSILQMPNGVPVATVALNAAKNAGILAAQIIGSYDENIYEKLVHFKKDMETEVLLKVKNLQAKGLQNNYDK